MPTSQEVKRFLFYYSSLHRYSSQEIYLWLLQMKYFSIFVNIFSTSNQGRAGWSPERRRVDGEGGGGGGAQVHHPQRQTQARHHLVHGRQGVCSR